MHRRFQRTSLTASRGTTLDPASITAGTRKRGNKRKQGARARKDHMDFSRPDILAYFPGEIQPKKCKFNYRTAPLEPTLASGSLLAPAPSSPRIFASSRDRNQRALLRIHNFRNAVVFPPFYRTKTFAWFFIFFSAPTSINIGSIVLNVLFKRPKRAFDYSCGCFYTYISPAFFAPPRRSKYFSSRRARYTSAI